MTFRPNLKALAIAASLLLGTAVSSHARSINWGSAVDDTLLYSAGGSLGDDVVFQLGSFGTGFTPDASNMSQWLPNWKVFDQAAAPASSGWNSAEGLFSSTATLNSDGTSTYLSPYTFAEGEQAYIWAFKVDQTLANGGEWALVTNDSSDG
ncbi:MAG: hypothetical protein JWO08_4691, partial [Verrucomicrobiaceae bacterium]|nr:hypothetical protein [Verrucomicrobiaceae bacterium]